MDDSHTRWRLGEPWLDLQPLLTPAGVATVVSIHGTATIVDLRAGRHQRIPLEGGHRLPRDGQHNALTRVLCATPCGVHAIGVDGWWHMTSRLILAVTGAHPRWLDSPLGRDVFQQVIRDGWAAPGHPPGPCGALRCVHGRAPR